MAEIVEIQMLALLREFDGTLPVEVFKGIESLIIHREWGVALENLCQELYEFDVPVEVEVLAKIQEMTQLMQLPSETWSFLVKD